MTVCVYKSFNEIPNEVRDRLSYPAQPNFFLSLDWFSLLFETSLLESLTPRIYVLLNDQGKAIGGLFCGVDPKARLRRLVSLTNFYALEFSPSVVEESAQRLEIITGLVRYIAAERPRWHLIGFSLLKCEMLEAQRVSDDLKNTGFSPYPFFQYENWYFESSGSTFENYFSGRSSQLRNTVTRKQKKLEKAHNVSIKIITNESDQLPEVLRDFIAIYNRSWKRPEPFPDFIPTLTNVCAKLGILRLAVLYVDGKPAAGQFWINTPGKAIIYKLAYDEEYKDLGVGSILSKEMFRLSLDEDRVGEIDYGVGSEPYKKDWMSSVRRIEGMQAFNRKTLVGLVLLTMQLLRPPLAAVLRPALSFMQTAMKPGQVSITGATRQV
ncbi:MAG TPA: GNAT family N-acetyltransferase [Terriglobia bacterium]|nr:GNAT family N-acetyltransferase [Terriglobia bacterium]